MNLILDMVVSNVASSRNEKGETIEELVSLNRPDGNAHLNVRLLNPADFGQVHPRQHFRIEISPAPPEPAAIEGDSGGEKTETKTDEG